MLGDFPDKKDKDKKDKEKKSKKGPAADTDGGSAAQAVDESKFPSSISKSGATYSRRVLADGTVLYCHDGCGDDETGHWKAKFEPTKAKLYFSNVADKGKKQWSLPGAAEVPEAWTEKSPSKSKDKKSKKDKAAAAADGTEEPAAKEKGSKKEKKDKKTAAATAEASPDRGDTGVGATSPRDDDVRTPLQALAAAAEDDDDDALPTNSRLVRPAAVGDGTDEEGSGPDEDYDEAAPGTAAAVGAHAAANTTIDRDLEAIIKGEELRSHKPSTPPAVAPSTAAAPPLIPVTGASTAADDDDSPLGATGSSDLLRSQTSCILPDGLLEDGTLPEVVASGGAVYNRRLLPDGSVLYCHDGCGEDSAGHWKAKYEAGRHRVYFANLADRTQRHWSLPGAAHVPNVWTENSPTRDRSRGDANNGGQSSSASSAFDAAASRRPTAAVATTARLDHPGAASPPPERHRMRTTAPPPEAADRFTLPPVGDDDDDVSLPGSGTVVSPPTFAPARVHPASARASRPGTRPPTRPSTPPPEEDRVLHENLSIIRLLNDPVVPASAPSAPQASAGNATAERRRDNESSGVSSATVAPQQQPPVVPGRTLPPQVGDPATVSHVHAGHEAASAPPWADRYDERYKAHLPDIEELQRAERHANALMESISAQQRESMSVILSLTEADEHQRRQQLKHDEDRRRQEIDADRYYMTLASAVSASGGSSSSPSRSRATSFPVGGGGMGARDSLTPGGQRGTAPATGGAPGSSSATMEAFVMAMKERDAQRLLTSALDTMMLDNAEYCLATVQAYQDFVRTSPARLRAQAAPVSVVSHHAGPSQGQVAFSRPTAGDNLDIDSPSPPPDDDAPHGHHHGSESLQLSAIVAATPEADRHRLPPSVAPSVAAPSSDDAERRFNDALAAIRALRDTAADHHSAPSSGATSDVPQHPAAGSSSAHFETAATRAGTLLAKLAAEVGPHSAARSDTVEEAYRPMHTPMAGLHATPALSRPGFGTDPMGGERPPLFPVQAQEADPSLNRAIVTRPPVPWRRVRTPALPCDSDSAVNATLNGVSPIAQPGGAAPVTPPPPQRASPPPNSAARLPASAAVHDHRDAASQVSLPVTPVAAGPVANPQPVPPLLARAPLHDSELAQQSAAQSQPKATATLLQWDERRSGSLVFNTDRTVIHTSSKFDDGARFFAIGTIGIARGELAFQVLLNVPSSVAFSSVNYFCVGVGSKNFRGFAGKKTSAYMLRSDGAVLATSDAIVGVRYCDPLPPEAQITVHLDLNNHELSFYVNGAFHGPAFRFDPVDDPEPLFPIVMFGDLGGRAELQAPTARLPDRVSPERLRATSMR